MRRLPTQLLQFLLLALLLSCAQGSGEREVSEEGDSVVVDPPDLVNPKDTPVGRHGALHVDGTLLMDEHNQPVQLRGVSSMWLNWETKGFARSYAGLMWMRDNWNISIIRAAVGVMDGEHQAVSSGYLSSPGGMERQVADIVDAATRLGLYVIIDWHDHFASDNQAEATTFFTKMSSLYKDHKNVLYETFNEPMPGVWMGDYGPYTWAEHFKPYHQAMNQVIRQNDSDAIIIMGTGTWSQDVDVAAKDPVVGDNLMYTLHFYACTHTQFLRDKALAALQLGAPLFVTEWGATDAGGGTDDKTVCDGESDMWLQLLADYGISWAAWKLDDCADASCFFKDGTRPGGDYATALQGHGPYVASRLMTPPVPVDGPRQGTSVAGMDRVPADGRAGSMEADSGTSPSADASVASPTDFDAGVPLVTADAD